VGNGQIADLQKYWDKDDDQLYELLGASLLGVHIGMSPEEQDRNRRFGKQWFDRQYHELQKRVCLDERVSDHLGTNLSDRILDVGALVGLLGAHDDYGINAVLISVLIARIGLGTFCAGVEAEG
jgi:hypothetical protein